jgi:hypothetical protein
MQEGSKNKTPIFCQSLKNLSMAKKSLFLGSFKLKYQKQMALIIKLAQLMRKYLRSQSPMTPSTII